MCEVPISILLKGPIFLQGRKSVMQTFTHIYLCGDWCKPYVESLIFRLEFNKILVD